MGFVDCFCERLIVPSIYWFLLSAFWVYFCFLVLKVSSPSGDVIFGPPVANGDSESVGSSSGLHPEVTGVATDQFGHAVGYLVVAFEILS